jgi:hypothetical protein
MFGPDPTLFNQSTAAPTEIDTQINVFVTTEI